MNYGIWWASAGTPPPATMDDPPFPWKRLTSGDPQMSLFSGFSTAIDEQRALQLSRKVSEKTCKVLATVARMHEGRDVGMGIHGILTCVECGKTWPCPTWNTATGAEK